MPHTRNEPLYTLSSRSDWLASLLFAALYVTVPWPGIFSRLYGYTMIDRTVYELLITSNNLRGDYFSFSSPLSYFTDEYLWSRTLRWLYSDLSVPVSVIFLAISFIGILLFSITLLRSLRWYWLFTLINPLIVDLVFSQLRLTLSISVILVVYLFVPAGRLKRLVLAAAATMTVSYTHLRAHET